MNTALTPADLADLGCIPDDFADLHRDSLHLATHNGTVTIENTSTGAHRTFRIRLQPADAKFAPGRRVVALLVGSDNRSDFQGFGFVSDRGRVSVWRRYRSGDGEPATTWEGFARMLGELIGDAPATFDHAPYVVHASTSCRRCNRKLSRPDSIRAGIGPVCAERERG